MIWAVHMVLTAYVNLSNRMEPVCFFLVYVLVWEGDIVAFNFSALRLCGGSMTQTWSLGGVRGRGALGGLRLCVTHSNLG